MDDGVTEWGVHEAGVVTAGRLSFPQLHGSHVFLRDQLI